MKSRIAYPLAMVFFFFLTFSLPGYGREDKVAADSSVTQRFRLLYRVDQTDIDPGYLDNTAQMDTIIRYLARSPRIDSIVVYAYASPEGGFRRNKWLAERRAEAAREFILSHLTPPQ